MIPPSTSRPFGRPSPRLSEVDLAKIITRTIKMAVDAKRELGFAAVSTGCDGRQRTTFFDGGSCQTEGEVCIAERQDGITACLQVQMQGSGIDFRSISFRPAPCEAVTGWYILDDAGFLYRIPSGLLTPYQYWPPTPLPSSVGYDMVRAGTWDQLMCAAALAPPTNNHDGGCSWYEFGLPGGEDTIWLQVFRAVIGGQMTYLQSVPGLTAGVDQVTVGGFTAVWEGHPITNGPANIVFDQLDRNGNALTAGQEYRAILYCRQTGGSTMDVQRIKGVRAAAGSAVLPTDSSPAAHFPIGEVTVPYDASGHATPTTVSTGTTFPKSWYVTRPMSGGSEGTPGRMTGILLRDVEAPNPGVRVVDITIPTAEGNVVTGPARVAFGYPMAFQMYDELPGIVAPFFCETHAQTLARDDYDSAIVYPPRLGIEYGVGHLNLCGPEIVDPGDSEILFEVSVAPTEIDARANLIQLPNGEIGLSRRYTNEGSPVVPQRWERYRVRPAPSDSAAFACSQAALGTWPVDTNAWVAPMALGVVSWTIHDTSFTLLSGSWTHGRPVPCVIWQSRSGQNHYTLDPDAVYGVLGQPSGMVCPVAFSGGQDAPARQPGTTCVVSVLGPAVQATYGWTFTYRDPVTGTEYESALSPLPEPTSAIPDPLIATYTRTITVPTGPTDTVRRTIYRFAYDADDGRVGGVLVSPWDSRSPRPGAVYDRMCVQIGTIEDNVTVDFIDEATTLSFSGVRPPEPLIPVGSGIVMDAPTGVVALPPLNL